MRYKTRLTNFLDWYCPADGDIFSALVGYIAKYPGHPRNYEKATAKRIYNYAKQMGVDLYDYAEQLEMFCCSGTLAEKRIDNMLAKLAA